MNKLKALFLKLVNLNNTPREIASGTAIGVFIGITPLYGFHTILVLIFAMLVPRTNKIAILAGSNLSNPLSAPFISWAGYSIGKFVLGDQYPGLHWSMLRNITYSDIKHLLYPLFLGSTLLGIVCMVLVYFLILHLVNKFRGRELVE